MDMSQSQHPPIQYVYGGQPAQPVEVQATHVNAASYNYNTNAEYLWQVAIPPGTKAGQLFQARNPKGKFIMERAPEPLPHDMMMRMI